MAATRTAATRPFSRSSDSVRWSPERPVASGPQSPSRYGPAGVRVNNVAPGPIHTRPEARDRFDQIGATTAVKRAAQPAEIAELVAFLASEKASYVTGATLAADGGRTAI
jgi:hypothetical protein